MRVLLIRQIQCAELLVLLLRFLKPKGMSGDEGGAEVTPSLCIIPSESVAVVRREAVVLCIQLIAKALFNDKALPSTAKAVIQERLIECLTAYPKNGEEQAFERARQLSDALVDECESLEGGFKSSSDTMNAFRAMRDVFSKRIPLNGLAFSHSLMYDYMLICVRQNALGDAKTM